MKGTHGDQVKAMVAVAEVSLAVISPPIMAPTFRPPPHPGSPPPATEGVLRYVWESGYGPILIEVLDDVICVNGKVVEAAV